MTCVVQHLTGPLKLARVQQMACELPGFCCFVNVHRACDDGSVQSWPCADMQTRLVGKLRKINALCAALGVQTAPADLGGVWVVPLLSWYHASWDREPDIAGARPVEKVCVSVDFPEGASFLSYQIGVNQQSYEASGYSSLSLQCSTQTDSSAVCLASVLGR